MVATIDSEQALVGRRIGSYTVLSLLGQGGMGLVYRARDEKLGRDVAMKVLRAGLLADPDRRARFDREARVLATLNHPHIGAIFALEAVDGASALVLELVEGPTLAEQLEHGPLPIDDTVAISRQIVDALHTAHEHGIVHRDLKPANIKIARGKHAKLLDFGIATVERAAFTTGDSTPVTVTGEVIGTAEYMSPEQVRGAAMDARSDQFSFGIILFEMLTGRRPFARGSAVETMAAILSDAPPAIVAIDASVPMALQSIVYRCLAKEPQARYSTTTELAKDLATLREAAAEPRVFAAASGRFVLPVSRTPLIGRETELAGVRSLLTREEVRLVTLTGTGGTGKTRLAIGVAAELGQAFAGGVYFVPLAPITDVALVGPAIVKVVGIRETGGRDPAEALKEALAAAREPVLLLLDNFEQVVAAAPLLTDLLESCARLKLLITSRAVLRVYGEHAFEVPALRLPAPGAASVSKIARSPAVGLFMQRAAAVKPDFKLTRENAPAIATVCTKLDGIPLAIELAAARVRMLTPAAMLERLQSRFDLLTGGARDLPARQQTLRATVEWSFGLLTPNEQKLFRRLGVFVNGATLEAAEAVCNARSDLGTSVLDDMESLIGQSLLQKSEPANGEARFSMLETIRDYALERLASSPDEALARKAHAAYCLVLAEERVDGADDQRADWLERCDQELENLRAALDWAVRTKNVEWGLRLSTALLPFWLSREHYAEARERLDALLALPGDALPRTRARALHAAGVFNYELGDFLKGLQNNIQAVEIHRQLGDTPGLIMTMNAVAACEMALKNAARARVLFEECAKLSLETGDEVSYAQSLINVAHTLKDEGDLVRAREVGARALAVSVRLNDADRTAHFESTLGDMDRALGDAAGARVRYDRALAMFAKVGDRSGASRTRIDLAALLFDQGDEPGAHEMLATALTTFRDLGNRRGIARALDEFAAFALRQGRADRGLRLGGAAEAIRRTVGASLYGSERVSLERSLGLARMRLGEGAAALEAAGRAMTIDAAIDYALRDARTATRS